MKSVYIVSYSPFSGKTAFALGLALCLKEEGINVGYFKPISVGTEVKLGRFVDRDVTLMKNVLGLNKKIAELSPPIETRIGTYTFGRRFLEDRDYYPNKIINAYNKIKNDYDFIIIEGRHRIQSLFTYELDAITLSKALDSKILLVSNGIIDDVMLQKTLIEGMDAKLLGTLFNNVSLPMISKIKGELMPLMERFNVKFYGYIPENIELISPTVEEYQSALGGQLLVGEKYLDKLVESAHIGAMRTDSSLRILNRHRNYALITGGDRSDLIYHALETDLALLILTGNFYPDVKILIKAEEKKVPVLLVNHETAVTYNICWTVKAGLAPRHKDKIDLIKTLVKEHIKWKQIYDDV
ncbi:MAG: phosphotransacetylase family protein [Candidatus Helarchaeota archaeon]|nr:phosphotransacetylase family protein [Candidatus Helarchaeota archaeon]